MNFYTLRELLITGSHRKIDINIYRTRSYDYRNEVQSDYETFKRYLEKLGIQDIIFDYIKDKDDHLTDNFRPLITYIFDINRTGKTKTYENSGEIIEEEIFDKDSGNIINTRKFGEIDKEKVRRNIQVDLSKIADKELDKAFTEISLILLSIFNQECEPLKSKYLQRLKGADLFLFHDVGCMQQWTEEIAQLPYKIVKNTKIPQDKKSKLLFSLENSLIGLLNEWDVTIDAVEKGKVDEPLDIPIGEIDRETGIVKIKRYRS